MQNPAHYNFWKRADLFSYHFFLKKPYQYKRGIYQVSESLFAQAEYYNDHNSCIASHIQDNNCEWY